MMETIEEELQYHHHKHPGYLQHFLTIMDEGHVQGDAYDDGEGNACFLGHLAKWKNADSYQEACQVRRFLNGGRYLPIEQLIIQVERGETPETTTRGGQALSTLKRAIE